MECSEEQWLDMLQSMLDTESQQKYPTMQDMVHYIPYRKSLITLIADGLPQRVHVHISKTEIHMAVYYMDRILSSFNLGVERYSLIACACLLIASKLDGKSLVTITGAEMRIATNFVFSQEDLKNAECEILTAFSWRLNVVTATHFMGHFLKYGCDPRLDMIQGQPLHEIDRVRLYLEKHAIFFCDLSLQYSEMCQYVHSIIGAACVYCARRMLYITPAWNNALAHFTTYTEGEIAECVGRLMHILSIAFPKYHSEGVFYKSRPPTKVSPEPDTVQVTS